MVRLCNAFSSLNNLIWRKIYLAFLNSALFLILAEFLPVKRQIPLIFFLIVYVLCKGFYIMDWVVIYQLRSDTHCKGKVQKWSTIRPKLPLVFPFSSSSEGSYFKTVSSTLSVEGHFLIEKKKKERRQEDRKERREEGKEEKMKEGKKARRKEGDS